jgi:hypothetical protein
MKARAWQDCLQQQRDQHEKVLFTITELAHIAGVSRAALNVELARLRQQGIVTQYAHGLYGMPGAVTATSLVPAIDCHAYITGHYALHVYNLVTQVPTRIVCFTDRRSPRARERDTPVGRLVFACVRSSVYAPPTDGAMTAPAQALCDYVYLARRDGVAPETLVTFRNLEQLCQPELQSVLTRYPATVQHAVERLVGRSSART